MNFLQITSLLIVLAGAFGAINYLFLRLPSAIGILVAFLAAVTLLGMPLVLYKKRDGDWAALEDACCHRLAPLSLGRLEGDELRCMYHGLKFGCDGRCTEIPGQAHVPEKVRVRAYPVEEKWGAVWVWMATRPGPIPG